MERSTYKSYQENDGFKKTIDVTPAWSGVLPLMLELYTQLASVGNRNLEQKNALAGLREEFEKMAKAADRYNESAKTVKS
jgi:hypothetical protein